MEASRHKASGVLCALLDIVHRGVFGHIFHVLLRVGVAPLFPFHHGEGDAGVDHSAHDVDKGDSEDGRLEELWCLVDAGSDQQPSSGPSLRRHQFAGGHLLVFLKPPCHVDEIVEGVLFAEVLGSVGLLVPLPSHFPSPTNVRDDVNDTSVKKGEPGGGKVALHARPVASVSVEVQVLGFSFLPHFLIPYDRYGNLRLSVPAEDDIPCTSVLRGIIARDNALLQTLPLANVVEFDLESLRGCHKTVVADQEVCDVELQVSAAPDVVRVLVEFQPLKLFDGLPSTELGHPYSRNSSLSSVGDEVVLEGEDIVEGTGCVAGEQSFGSHLDLLPLSLAFGFRVAAHELHVHETSVVGGDEPLPLPVLNFVKGLGPSLANALNLEVSLEVDEVDFARLLTPAPQEEELPVLALGESQPEEFIVLLEKLGVIPPRAYLVDEGLVRPVRLVHLAEEYFGVILAPDDPRVNLPLELVDDLPSLNVLDEDSVRLTASVVHGVSEELSARASRAGPHGTVLMALSKQVFIKEHNLPLQNWRLGLSVPADRSICGQALERRPTVDLVRLALESSSVVNIVSLLLWGGVVCLLEETEHL
mmetsp:Transcript_12923/g.26393  ORF Transcript_12923/g.26393 Transcript_12923/m.26393 type:complete len:588 (-) Transcript_12923:409-2172(-)